MRWPWRKARDVEEALSGSAKRLAAVKAEQAKLEPQFRTLRAHAGVNHFEETVTQGFRVVR